MAAPTVRQRRQYQDPYVLGYKKLPEKRRPTEEGCFERYQLLQEQTRRLPPHMISMQDRPPLGQTSSRTGFRGPLTEIICKNYFLAPLWIIDSTL